MKFTNLFSNEKSCNKGRFVFVQLNENLNEILVKDSENKELSAKQRLIEGEQTALQALPKWANDMVDKISANKEFFKAKTGILDRLRGVEDIDSVQKFVRDSIFNVIQDGITQNKISPRVKSLWEDIENGKEDFENTIGDVEQAIGTVNKLSDSLQHKLNSLQKYQSADDARKHWWQKWKTKASSADYFSQRRNVIETALSDLKSKLENRKSTTQKNLQRTVDGIKGRIDRLSGDDQKKFRRQMQQEINDNQNYHRKHAKKSHLDNEFILGVMENTESLERRLEIYKMANLDNSEKDQNLKIENSRFASNAEKYAEAQKAFEKDSTDNLNNVETLKTNFEESLSENDKVEPFNDLDNLVKEFEEFFRGIFPNLKDALWDAYPLDYELTNLEKFTSFLAKLGKGEENFAKKVPKSLKIKLLGYLKYINNHEAGENSNKYSPEFVATETKAKESLEATKELFDNKDTGLKSKSTLDDVCENKKLKKDINNSINKRHFALTHEISDLQKKVNILSGTEKEKIAKYINILQKAQDALKSIQTKWNEEIKAYNNSVKEYNAKKSELENNKEVAKKIKDETKDLKNEYKAEDGSKTEKPHEEYIKAVVDEAKSETLLNKIKEPTLAEAEFTTVETNFFDTLQELEINFKEANESKTETKFSVENIKNFIKDEAQKPKNENPKMKAEFQKTQETMLKNLSEKSVGSTVKLVGKKYNSGLPPTMLELANSEKSDKNEISEEATIWATSANTVVLKSDKKIIIFQKSTTNQKVEMVGFDVSAASDQNDKDAVIDEFRQKEAAQKHSFVASPISVTPIN